MESNHRTWKLESVQGPIPLTQSKPKSDVAKIGTVGIVSKHQTKIICTFTK